MNRSHYLASCALLMLTSCGHEAQPGVDSPSTASTKAVGPEPFIFGEVQRIASSILDQERTLNVYLPDGYSPDSATTYPVIYVLDGSANEDFPHIAGLAQFMNMYELLPKSIVVGIANVDRKHDFTHPTRNDSDKVWVPNSGGSEAFIKFIGEELQPFIMKTYRTNGSRTLIGQSLGGLLGTEILFTHPELFDNYILVSPSLWWDDGSLSLKADAWCKENAGTSRTIYIAMASDDDMMQDDIDRVRAAFTTHAKAPFRWTYQEFPDETHATILHEAVYRAFLWKGRE